MLQVNFPVDVEDAVNCCFTLMFVHTSGNFKVSLTSHQHSSGKIFCRVHKGTSHTLQAAEGGGTPI